jgi:tRNA A-37 threonylcarbamoyl transferase component Bud32
MNDILPAIEAALSDAWGGPVRVTFHEYLESRRHIARLDVLMSSPELPKSVVVKRWRSEGDAGFDQNSFDDDLLNEWASLEFVAHRLGQTTLAPQIYAGDQAMGFFVIEDLVDGATLDGILRGTDAIQAEHAFKRYGEALGQLHAQTLGHSDAFIALQRKLDYRGPVVDGYLGFMQTSLKRLEALNFRIPPTADSEVRQAAEQLSQLAIFSALHHGDPIPSNTWLGDQDKFYFIDFEGAHFDHAILEAVGPRMMFPTCGLAFVNRIPEPIWRQTEAAYQAVLVQYCPEATDKILYGSAVTAACAKWALAFCERWLRAALDNELPGYQLKRVRQCAIARLEAFTQAAREFNSLPALGETFTGLLADLRLRWSSESQTLPPYPVFQEGNSQ